MCWGAIRCSSTIEHIEFEITENISDIGIDGDKIVTRMRRKDKSRPSDF